MPPKFSFGSILIIITLFSLGLFFKNEITELIYEPAHPAKAFVEKQIKSNPVVVFSKSYCPHSKRAISVLEVHKAGARVFQLDQMDEGASIQNYIATRDNHRTVPAVYIHQKFIGGASDIDKLAGNGELDKILKK